MSAMSTWYRIALTRVEQNQVRIAKRDLMSVDLGHSCLRIEHQFKVDVAAITGLARRLHSPVSPPFGMVRGEG